MDRLLKNTSWIMINQIFNMVVSFFVGLLTIRYLGPSNYGSITYISSYVAFFSAVALMGMDTVVISRLVHYPDRDGEVMASALLLRTLVSAICMGALCLVISIVDHGDRTLLWIAFLSGFEILFKAIGTITFWYQYRLLSKKTSIADMIAFTMASIYRIWLLATGKSVYWFAFYNSLIYLIAIGFYIWMFRKDHETPLKPSREMCMDLLKVCVPYLISGVMISMYMQIDRVMIKQIMGDQIYVGYYSAAVTICNLIAFVPGAISLSARPVLLQLKESGNPNYLLRLRQVLAVIIWFSLCYAVFITVFARPVILGMFGADYTPSILVLRIMIWCTLVENLTRIRDIWLIGEGKQKYVSVFSLAGTVLNIIFNFTLIHLYGIYGAAAATVLTQFIVMWGIPAVFRDTRVFAKAIGEAFILRDVRVRELLGEVFTALKHRTGGKQKG